MLLIRERAKKSTDNWQKTTDNWQKTWAANPRTCQTIKWQLTKDLSQAKNSHMNTSLHDALFWMNTSLHDGLFWMKTSLHESHNLTCAFIEWPDLQWGERSAKPGKTLSSVWVRWHMASNDAQKIWLGPLPPKADAPGKAFFVLPCPPHPPHPPPPWTNYQSTSSDTWNSLKGGNSSIIGSNWQCSSNTSDFSCKYNRTDNWPK